MRLTHLLSKKVIIARMANVSGDIISFTTVTAQMMHIQPSGDSKNEIADGVFGKKFRIYTEGEADLQEGDRLKDDDGNFYTVVSDGVSRRTIGTFDYLIAVVEKTK